jgi:hypothetical protein
MRFGCVPPSASPGRRYAPQAFEKAKRDRQRFAFEGQ